MALTSLFVTETWLSAQSDEAKTVELAPSGMDDVKSFLRQSRSRGVGIATVYKSTFGSNITFKTNFDFTHTSFEVVQASITLQHNTLHFFLSVPHSTKPTKHSYWLYVYWTAAWPSRLCIQTLRICLSCRWYEYPLSQSITITNQTDCDYS